MLLYIMISLLAGGCTIISMTLNSQLAQRIGLLQSSLINFIAGLIPTVLFLIFTRSNLISAFSNLEVNRIWICLGGAIGILVVITSNIVIPKIPVIYSTLLIFIGQLFIGTIIDYFMGMPISKGKLIGGVLILAGLFYNFRVDKKYSESNQPTALDA